jgi:hypothetical protein
VQQEKVARETLSRDLADVIHDVLSTTQFATKALKPKRYADAEPLDSPELPELAEELSASLPKPVAIKSRLGRMERLVAFASVGMLLVVAYFGVSLWRGDTTAAKQAAVLAVTAPHSEIWRESDHDVTRGLGSIAAVTEAPKPSAGNAPSGASRNGAHAPQTAQ